MDLSPLDPTGQLSLLHSWLSAYPKDVLIPVPKGKKSNYERKASLLAQPHTPRLHLTSPQPFSHAHHFCAASRAPGQVRGWLLA
jgi:hypothetical protein